MKPTKLLLLFFSLFFALSSILNAQSLTGTFQCKSIYIGSAQGPNGLSVAFTTRSAISSQNPQLPFNGEFQPSDTASIDFQSYWVMYRSGSAVDLGVLGFGSSAVKTDSDSNGIPDFAERSKAANAVATIVAISEITGGSDGGTITLTRSAGQESGTTVTRFDSGSVFSGTWRIPILDVSGSYSSSQKTFSIRTASSFWVPGTMTGSYSRNSDDEVAFSNIIYKLDTGETLTAGPVAFRRYGKVYRALVEFGDANLATKYPDYQRWTLQFTDNSDSDGDGIPNLSDATPELVAPTILSGPENLTRQVGQSAQFSVSASGSGALQYEWRFNGKAIPGAVSSIFVVASVKATDAGSYSVLVKNGSGSVLSSTATLTVTSPIQAPGITQQPVGATVSEGQNVLLSVKATGTDPLSYQWQKDGLNIPGATSGSFSIGNIGKADAGNYSVTVSNAAGTVRSQIAAVQVTTIAAPPNILSQPQNIAVLEGQSATLSVSASGTLPLTYQWRRDGVDIPGATASTLSWAKVLPSQSGVYSVVIRNSVGQITSNPASITVSPAGSGSRIVSLKVLSPVEVEMSLSAVAGKNYDLEASSDLKTWTKVQVFSPGQGVTTLKHAHGGKGALMFRVTESGTTTAGPILIQEPADQEVPLNGVATFSVKVQGSGPYTYQWMKNGLPLTGRTLSSWSIIKVRQSDAGVYEVVVTGPEGTTTSKPATLTVAMP